MKSSEGPRSKAPGLLSVKAGDGSGPSCPREDSPFFLEIDVPEGAATVKVWHVAQLVDKTPLETSVSAAPTRITFPLNVVSRGSRL